MAYCLRSPVLSPAGLQFFRPFQQRPFSIASSQWAMARGEMGPQPRQQSERSVKVASREMGKMANDLGLLPRTPPLSPPSSIYDLTLPTRNHHLPPRPQSSQPLPRTPRPRKTQLPLVKTASPRLLRPPALQIRQQAALKALSATGGTYGPRPASADVLRVRRRRRPTPRQHLLRWAARVVPQPHSLAPKGGKMGVGACGLYEAGEGVVASGGELGD